MGLIRLNEILGEPDGPHLGGGDRCLECGQWLPRMVEALITSRQRMVEVLELDLPPGDPPPRCTCLDDHELDLISGTGDA